MEKMGGQWPSLAPTNSILQHKSPDSPSRTTPSASEEMLSSRTVPGCPKEAPIQCPEAGQGHQKGDQGRQALQGAVGKRLQVKDRREI